MSDPTAQRYEGDFIKEILVLLECVLANKPELVQSFTVALRKNVFNNRIEIRPGNLPAIAGQEAEVVIAFLGADGTARRAIAYQHGVALCELGLSNQSVIALHRVLWDLFFRHLGSFNLVGDAIFNYSSYVADGYLVEHENMIRKEQENIRIAFEIALHNKNEIIREAQNLVQRATEASYRRVILAQEDERSRISRELHDEAGQALIGIRMSLENLSADLPDYSIDKRERIHKAIFWAEHAMKQIRNLAYSLRPPMLDLLGINLTIKQLCIDFSQQTGLVIRYEGIELPTLDNDFSISLYRFVQESLTNVVKHAHAKHAWVTLKLGGQDVELSVQDDGKGFDPRIVSKGIGLNGMDERLRLLNGRMEIVSEKKKMTTIRFYVPIPQPAGVGPAFVPDNMDGSGSIPMISVPDAAGGKHKRAGPITGVR